MNFGPIHVTSPTTSTLSTPGLDDLFPCQGQGSKQFNSWKSQGGRGVHQSVVAVRNHELIDVSNDGRLKPFNSSRRRTSVSSVDPQRCQDGLSQSLRKETLLL